MKQLGLYIHWPYCGKICPYCDFNVYRARNHDHAPLLKAIHQELRSAHAKVPSRPLTSIFFGGGTPSLLSPAELGGIIELCDNLWGFAPEPEISIETNPDDADLIKLRGFRAAGINRLSLGVQSFDDNALKALGRFHSAHDAIQAAENARQAFDNLSIDLIYARPNQSLEQMFGEFGLANKIGIDHISPYQLTIEPNTAYERKVKRGTIIPKPDEEAGDFYDAANKYLEEIGFKQYEISNHAKTHETQSKHNLIYWKSQDFIGIGPGAHGRFDLNKEGIIARFATQNIARPEEYIDAINQNNNAFKEYSQLSHDDIIEEYYIMGLRLIDGCEIIGNGELINIDRLKYFIDSGFMSREGNTIRIENAGRRFSDYIISNLL